MLSDNPCERSRRTGSRASDASIEQNAGPVSGDSSMAASPAVTLRDAATRLKACPHCGNEAVYRWGKNEVGVPRGRCRACERTFSARTGTWLAGIRETEKFACVLKNMITEEPGSCRQLAGALKLDKMTVWRWRRKISQSLLDADPAPRSDVIEIQGEPIRESRKASREWVDHHRDPARFSAPNRPRWVDVDRHGLPLPNALIAYQLRVLITAAQGRCQPIVVPLACPSAARGFCDGCTSDGPQGAVAGHRHSLTGVDRSPEEVSVAPTSMEPPPAAVLLAAVDGCRVGRSSNSCAAGWRPERGFSGHNDHAEDIARAPVRPGTESGVLRNLQQSTRDCFAAAFRAFLRPFAGPAAKYLRAYAAWFIKRLEGSDEGRLERTWTRLMA